MSTLRALPGALKLVCDWLMTCLATGTRMSFEDYLDAKRAIAEAKRRPPRPTIAEALEAAGYREIPLVGMQPPAPEYPPATVEEIEVSRGRMMLEDWNAVAVCRGSKKGCERKRGCGSCLWVTWHDTRPSDEILASMLRGDA